MNELTMDTLLAVFEEMFGYGIFWLLVVAATCAAVALLWIIWRDRGVDSRTLLRAELSSPLGAVAAILFVQWATNSGFSDIGGPIDVIVLIVIGVVGAVGATILAYEAQAFTRQRRPGPRAEP